MQPLIPTNFTNIFAQREPQSDMCLRNSFEREKGVIQSKQESQRCLLLFLLFLINRTESSTGQSHLAFVKEAKQPQMRKKIRLEETFGVHVPHVPVKSFHEELLHNLPKD